AILRFATRKAAGQQRPPRQWGKSLAACCLLSLALGWWWAKHRQPGDHPAVPPVASSRISSKPHTLSGAEALGQPRGAPAAPLTPMPAVVPTMPGSTGFVARAPTKFSHCVSTGGLPDAECTPGAVLAIGVANVCTTRTGV